MRLHQPMPALDALERFLREPGVPEAVAARHVLPAREPRFAPFPEWLDGRLVGALEHRGISALYSHQREALDALHDGEDVIIVTPTASGKSLCYNLPVLQEICEGSMRPGRSTSSPPRPSARTSWRSSATSPDRPSWTFRRRSTTATRPPLSARWCVRRARSWSPTRTCSAPPCCPTTPSGSSSSSSCATSWSTRSTPTAASSAATWPTCFVGCCACALTTAAAPASSAPRPRSATPVSWPRR